MNPSTLPSLSPSSHPTVCSWHVKFISERVKTTHISNILYHLLHYIIQTSPTSSPTVSTINRCAYFSSSLSCASLNPYILMLHSNYTENANCITFFKTNSTSNAVASNSSSNGKKEAWSVRYTYMLSLVLEKMANNLELLLQSTHREIQLRSQHSSRQRIQRNNLHWSQQIVQQYEFCTYDLFFHPLHPNMLLLYFVLLVILETSNGKWNWIHILWSFLEANLIFFCSMIFTHMHSS